MTSTVLDRSAKEMQGADSAQQGFDLKTTGQKWSSDEYHTLSSLTSAHDDRQTPATATTVSDDPTKIDVYPVLTTDLPPYVARNKYVRNANGYSYVGRQGYRQDDGRVVDDQRSEYATDAANAVSKWNRYDFGTNKTVFFQKAISNRLEVLDFGKLMVPQTRLCSIMTTPQCIKNTN